MVIMFVGAAVLLVQGHSWIWLQVGASLPIAVCALHAATLRSSRGVVALQKRQMSMRQGYASAGLSSYWGS